MENQNIIKAFKALDEVLDESILEESASKRKTVKPKSKLTEGTSNFKSFNELPLYAFAIAGVDGGGELPELNGDEIDDLRNDIDVLSAEIVDWAYDNLSDREDGSFEDMKSFGGSIEVRDGYYEGAQISFDETYFKDLPQNAKEFIIGKLKKIASEYGLRNLRVAWVAGNGETAYESLREGMHKKGEVAAFLKNAFADLWDDPIGTFYMRLTDALFVVVGPVEEDAELTVRAKIAFNCDDLQMDYDWDWLGVSNKDGDVIDYEIELSKDSDFDRIADNFIKYADELQSLIYSGDVVMESKKEESGKKLTEKQGFVRKVGKYSIIDAGDRYVITNGNGLNVGETKFGLPVAIDIAQGMEDEDNKKAETNESVNINAVDQKKIKQWWEDIDSLGKFNINNTNASIEEMHSAMFDTLSDLAKDDSEEAKRLLRRGKALYNKYALSPFVLKEDTTKKLEPKFDSRKSFYGKARVVEKDDGSKVLYSYSTPVVRIKDGKATLLRKGYVGWNASPTTLRHVKDFLAQNGFKVGGYKDLAKMYPEEQADLFECKHSELSEGIEANVSDEKDIKDAKEFLKDGEKEDDVEQIVDVNAEDVEDLKKSYVGDVILECPVCHTKVFKEPEELRASDDENNDGDKLYNCEEDCPHCGTSDKGFVIVGQVATYEPEGDKAKPEDGKPEEKPEEETQPEGEGSDDKADEIPMKESVELKDGDSKARYYIRDLVPDVNGEFEHEFSEFKTEKGFFDSLEYNHEIAVEYGDEMDPIEEIERKFRENENYEEESVNGFAYIKLTGQTLADYEGVPESELGEIELLEGMKSQISIEGIDEGKFDEIICGKLKEAYKGVKSYKTTDGTVDANNKIILEGVVEMSSGKKKDTKFTLECFCRKGKAKVKAVNEGFVKIRKPMIIDGLIDGSKLICESLSK